MRKILIILFVLISNLSYGQKPTDIIIRGNSLIDFKNFNVDLIESLVLKKINEYRKSNNKVVLVEDIKLKNLSRKWSKTMDSLEIFEHNNWKLSIFECIQAFKNSSADPMTYNKLSEEIFMTWKESKGHNYVMLLDEATIGSVGVSYEYEKCTQPTNPMFNDVDWCATFKKSGTFNLYVTFNSIIEISHIK